MKIFKKKHLDPKIQSKEIANLQKQELSVRERVLMGIAGQIADIHAWTPAETKRTQKIVFEHLVDEMKDKDINFLQRVYEQLSSNKSFHEQTQITLDEKNLKTFPNGLDIKTIKHVSNELTAKNYTPNHFDNAIVYAKEISTLAPKFTKQSQYHPHEFQGFERQTYYVLTNLIGNILAIVPADAEHIHDGVAVMKNTTLIKDKYHNITSAPYKIGLIMHLPMFDQIYDDNQIIFDSKAGTVTKLGNAKVAELSTSHDDKTAVIKIVRPLNAIVRHFIGLDDGKYCTKPQIFVQDDNGKTLEETQNPQRLERKVQNRATKITTAPTASMPEMLMQDHVDAQKFLEINQKGEIRLKCPLDKQLANHNAVIVKTPQGKYVARVDYPQAVISEEFYKSDGTLLNQRFFDFDSNRLILEKDKQQKLSSFECEK